MCMYSLYVTKDERTRAKVGETLIKTTFRNHAVMMTDDGKVACIKHGTVMKFDKLQIANLCSLPRNIMRKFNNKPVTVTFITFGHSSYQRAADGFVLPGEFRLHIAHLADDTTASIPRKVRKDKGTKKPRDLRKVLRLDQIEADIPVERELVEAND